MPKKIIYHIKITGYPKQKPGIWYAKKQGEVFQATLVTKNIDEQTIIVFAVSSFPFYHVYQDDCEIIDQQTIDIKNY
jgi:hypothetical protein